MIGLAEEQDGLADMLREAIPKSDDLNQVRLQLLREQAGRQDGLAALRNFIRVKRFGT